MLPTNHGVSRCYHFIHYTQVTVVLPANSRMLHKRTATFAYPMFGLLANRDGWEGRKCITVQSSHRWWWKGGKFVEGGSTALKNIDFVFAFFDGGIFTVEATRSLSTVFFFCTVCNAPSSTRAVVCCLSVYQHAACVLHKCATLIVKHFTSTLTSKWMLSFTVVFYKLDQVLNFDLVH